MKFFPISIEEYIKLHLADNPSENEKDYRKRLNSALADYKNGVKCSCGNDIWVIGSAIVEKSCFTCIAGEDTPDDDYEIDSAMHNAENKIGRRHIDDMDPFQISGIFDDDGFQINADIIKKPDVCLTCIHDNDPNEEMLCNLTRNDQKDDDDFVCFSYKKNSL